MKKELEAELIRQLVKYGGHPFYTLDDGSWVSVGEYIIEELASDEVVLQHPDLARIITEYVDNCLPAHIPPEADAQKYPTNYFLYHNDQKLSHIATHLIAERHQLSTIHSRHQTIVSDEDRLMESIPRTIISYKDYLLKERFLEKQRELRRLGNGQPTLEVELMTELRNISNMRKEYAHHLGDRTILNKST